MKGLLVWPICWSLYWIGDLAARVVDRCPSADDPVRSSRFCEAMVNIYQRAMQHSFRLQGWAEGGVRYSRILPWQPPAKPGDTIKIKWPEVTK